MAHMKELTTRDHSIRLMKFSEWVWGATGFRWQPSYERNLTIGVALSTGAKVSELMKEYGLSRSQVERVGRRYEKAQDTWLYLRDHWGQRLPVWVLHGTRLVNCLRNEGVQFLDEINNYEEAYWLRVPNMGKVSVKSMYKQLDDYGYPPATGYSPATECPFCHRKFWP